MPAPLEPRRDYREALMRVPSLSVALLLVMTSAAHAAGINLSWIDCGVHGQPNRTFACNTSSGSNTIYASFVPPPGMTQFNGLDAVIDIETGGGQVPDWWQFGTGRCRAFSSLVVSANVVTNFNCDDPWRGNAAEGSQYLVNLGDAHRARLRITAATPISVPLDSTVEWYAFKVTINNAKTVDTGSGTCAGCGEPMCLTLRYIHLTQPTGRPDYYLYTPL
jgi:hypothetical protein